MKSKIFTLFLMLCTLVATNGMASKKNVRTAEPVSQVSLSGVVLDKSSNEQLAGVTIQFPSLDQKIYSNVRGEFKIDGLEPGTYKVKVNCISYKDKELSLRVTKTQSDKLKIFLNPIEP